MGILILSVGALDAAVAWFVPHPRLLCAIIPTLIPLLTPALLISFGIFDQSVTKSNADTANTRPMGDQS
jgi:hypothetical protein